MEDWWYTDTLEDRSLHSELAKPGLGQRQLHPMSTRSRSSSFQCQGSISLATPTSPCKHTLDSKILRHARVHLPLPVSCFQLLTLADTLGHQEPGLHTHTAHLTCNTHIGQRLPLTLQRHVLCYVYLLCTNP